jgi:hypothetical protein
MTHEDFKIGTNTMEIGKSSTSGEQAIDGYEGALIQIASISDSDPGGRKSWKELGQEAAGIALEALRLGRKSEDAGENKIYQSALEQISRIENREGNLSWKDRAEIAMETANEALLDHYQRAEAYGNGLSWEEQGREAKEGMKVCLEYALKDIQEAGIKAADELNPEIYSETVGRARQELVDLKKFDATYGFAKSEDDPALNVMVKALTEITGTRAGWKEIGPATAEIAGDALREIRELREQDLAVERQSRESEIGLEI